MSAGRIPLAAIQRATAEHYGVSLARIVAPDGRGSRDAMFVRPRHVAMYLCRQLVSVPGRRPNRRFAITFSDIGRAFGHRDHSSVIHAVDAIRSRLLTDSELQADVRSILAALQRCEGQPLLLEAA